MSFLPFGIVFHGVLLLLSSCAARHFGLVFHIFYTLRSVFFLYACPFAYPIVCRVFYSRSLLLTFSFPQLVPVFGNVSSLFLCLFVSVIEVKTLVFSSLFPRALLFSRLLFTWHF